MKHSTPARLASVDLPAFPLQLLLRLHPEWCGRPAAVVAEDKPQGLILWVNEKARAAGVLPGQRYAAALSLITALRAGEVPPAEIHGAIHSLTHALMKYSPDVEASTQEAGVFWLNGAGLQRLYASPERWGGAIHGEMRAQGFDAHVVIGFTRFSTYALSRLRPGVTVFHDPAEERAAADEVPLDRLDIEPEFRDTLLKLGIKTIGALLALPPGGLRERFGPKAHRLYRMAAGELWSPLAPCAPEEPITQKCILDYPESDTTRLLFIVKQLLHTMLSLLAGRGEVLAALRLSLLPDKLDWRQEQIRPAVPTLEDSQIIDLVRLRLESMALCAGVVEIELDADGFPASAEQLRLFSDRPLRDLDAANRALARLRAEFGDNAVVRAVLKDGHLPEARFAWEPLDRIESPRPDLNRLNDLNTLNSAKVLVRRIAAKPVLLSGGPYPTHEDAWLLLDAKYGSVDKLNGPYVFAGGWWNREIQREYYFAETRRGDLLWIYFDRLRRRWFLQGWVE
jgi:protein ImuB